MKIVIDIDEEDIKDIGNLHFIREDLKFKVGKAIMNGTPLTELIEDIKADIDKLHKVGNANDGKVYVPINDVFDVIDKHIEVGTSKSLPEGSEEE